MFTTYNKLHGVRSGMESLRNIYPLVFDEEVADNFIKFEREWKVYQAAALSEKTKKIQSCILLNLASADAILKAESFQYTTHESREDPEVLLTKFREQCMPTKNIIIDRHRFNTTNQKPTEPISSYVASLRILAYNCEFGTLTDELIRDRIVCGIHSDRVRKHLLYESKLTLESAVTICKSNEQSEQNQKLLNKESDVHALHKTYKPAHKHSKHHGKQASKSEVTNQTKTQYKSNNYDSSNSCYNCGTIHAHYNRACPAYGKTCNKCNRHNHYSKMCRSSNKPQRVNELQEQSDESYFYCDSLVTDKNNGIHVSVIVSDTNSTMIVKLDTGAQINCISKNMLNSVTKHQTIDNSVTINLVAYGGEQFSTMGTTTVKTNYGDIKFHVINKDVKTILGLSDILRLDLIKLDSEVHSINNAPEIISEYNDLFESSLGKLPMVYHMKLDESITPFICSARKIPVAMRDGVINEL